MIQSAAIPVTHDGKPAHLSVIRNDGYCWGRITFTDDTAPLDVNTARDWYDQDDDDALQGFKRAARHPGKVSAAQGWL